MNKLLEALKDVLTRAQGWPEVDQAELIEVAQEIEARHAGAYRATDEELAAIDEAEHSGVASDKEVEAAFRKFRSA
jgi:hypothetical protein